MVKRIIAAIPALALLVLVVYFHGLYAKIVVAAAGLICMHEMMNVVAKDDARPIRAVGYLFAALAYPAYEFWAFTGIMALYALCMMAVFIVLIITDKDLKAAFMTVFVLLYPGLFLVFLIAVVCVPVAQTARFLMIIAFGAAAVTDTFAYFSGRLFGKRKLAERISPKKTVGGAVGGTVFGTCAVYLLGLFVQGAFGVGISPYWYFLLGLTLSVLTQFGDLSASIIKRKFGVKDYGKIMGEHGGAMDRLDSVLFICPAVFAFYCIIAP
ncbi:MAG: phosphatidate cytidylyltransferase [Christensenellales bacterium]